MYLRAFFCLNVFVGYFFNNKILIRFLLYFWHFRKRYCFRKSLTLNFLIFVLIWCTNFTIDKVSMNFWLVLSLLFRFFRKLLASEQLIGYPLKIFLYFSFSIWRHDASNKNYNSMIVLMMIMIDLLLPSLGNLLIKPDEELPFR